MLIVALTGGIGSGKTAVAHYFAELGVPVIESDQVARDVVATDSNAYRAIVDYFGKDILQADKNLDRRKLRTIVFNNAEKRQWLEDLLHPLIWGHIKDQLAILNAPYCIIAIPLLIESKHTPDIVDRILVVDTSETLQVERSKLRDNANEAEIKKILDAQASRQARLNAADDVINNTNDLASLKEQVKKLHEGYVALKAT